MLERLRIFESYCASSYRQEKEAHKTLEENIKILAEQLVFLFAGAMLLTSAVFTGDTFENSNKFTITL